MDHQTVAHYCKKLEKQGFIICTTLQKNSERKVFPREEYINKFRRIVSTFYPSIYYLDRFPYKMYKNEEAHQVIENLLDMISYPLWRSKPKEVVIDEDIQPQSQVCCVDFNEMTIRECIINLIDCPEKYLNVQKPEGLTISEIADAVGLTNEEKLISRILSDIQKKNSYIKSQAFRLGRIFCYKYYSTRKQKNLGVQKLSTNLTRNTELRSDERKEENKQESNMIYAQSARQLELNDECLNLIRYITEREQRKQCTDGPAQMVKDYFIKILKSKNKKRSITIDTINRYIYSLNLIYKYEVLSMIELKYFIKNDLERGCGWDIDNKTVRRMTGLLKEHGIIRAYEFEIKYIPQEDNESEDSQSSEEYVEDYSDNEDDPEFKLKKIKKPQNKQIKETQKSEIVNESKHLKIILTKPSVDPNDERITNDPSITNPSLRQDKELPNSILKRVIDNKKKQQEDVKEIQESKNIRITRQSKNSMIESLIVKTNFQEVRN